MSYAFLCGLSQCKNNDYKLVQTNLQRSLESFTQQCRQIQCDEDTVVHTTFLPLCRGLQLKYHFRQTLHTTLSTGQGIRKWLDARSS